MENLTDDNQLNTDFAGLDEINLDFFGNNLPMS